MFATTPQPSFGPPLLQVDIGCGRLALVSRSKPLRHALTRSILRADPDHSAVHCHGEHGHLCIVSQAEAAWTPTKGLGSHSSTRPAVTTEDNRSLWRLGPSSPNAHLSRSAERLQDPRLAGIRHQWTGEYPFWIRQLPLSVGY